MQRPVFFLIGFLFFLTVKTSAQYTPLTVPNTKLVTGSYVSNPDQILDDATIAEIDGLLRDLENKSTAQVAVVMLKSIGDYDEFTFSQELFDEWKIGSSKNDNGLLILYVEDQRVIRFHTGYGIEGVLPDAICKKIQMEKMVPHFREGNVNEGMLEGIKEVSSVLNNPEVAQFYRDATAEQDIPLYGFTVWIILLWALVATITFFVKKSRKGFVKNETTPASTMSSGGWFFWFLIFPVALMIGLSLTDHAGIFFGGLYAYLGSSFLIKRRNIDAEASRWEKKEDYQSIYNFYQQNKTLFGVLRFLFPLPFAFMFGSYKERMQFYRDHPRNCRQCGSPLAKLDEQSDDTYLTKSQLVEEGLKSVDYDIWKCPKCNAADKLSYINPSSKYKACPKCQAHAYYLVSNSTITAATTSSSGTGEEIHACKSCGNRNVRRYTIPKVVQSSSSSSGGSSGGSWGGGSSGGGGSSSRW